jgi:hypothetical protein
MARRLTGFLEQDHALLGARLRETLRPGGAVDLPAFDVFRHGLLRHITIEERVLMPALLAALGHPPVFQNGLRMDHAGFATLCVTTPCHEWVEDLADLLEHHQRVEEEPGGFYDLVDAYVADEGAVRAAIARLPPLRLPPVESGPRVRELLARVLYEVGVATDAYPLSVL